MQISLIIPTYNRAKELQRALQSIFSSSLKPHETIVVDDGSSDDTQTLMSDFDIKYIYQENQGVSRARNVGLQNASCEWIAFLDSDDEWHKDKLAKQVSFHTQNPHILCSQTNEIWKVNGKFKNQPKRYEKQQGDIFTSLMRVCNVTTSSFLSHRSIFEDIGVFDESLRTCEDQDLFLRIAKKYKFGLLDEALITKHAGSPNQLSFTTPLMDIYRIKALFKHKEAKEEIQKKCDILFKGAIKNNNQEVITFVQESLHHLADNHP